MLSPLWSHSTLLQEKIAVLNLIFIFLKHFTSTAIWMYPQIIKNSLIYFKKVENRCHPVFSFWSSLLCFILCIIPDSSTSNLQWYSIYHCILTLYVIYSFTWSWTFNLFPVFHCYKLSSSVRFGTAPELVILFWPLQMGSWPCLVL